MKVEKHTSPAVFDQLEAEWQALLNPDQPEGLFLSPTWQRLWWSYLGRGDLAVLSVRADDGQLAGVGSWFVESEAGQRVIRGVGCVETTDYLDVVYGPDGAEAVLGALVDYLAEANDIAWDLLDLCNIPADSPTLQHLPALAQAKGWQVETRVQAVVPVVALPDDYETYLANLNKKQRHEMRRKRRRAEAWEGGTAWYTVGPQHNLTQETGDFLALMAASAPDKADFLAEGNNRAFFEALAQVGMEEGWLRLQMLRAADDPAGAIFAFACGGHLMVYNSGMDITTYGPLSPGWVLFGYSIEDAIEQGFKAYNFLRGDEDYKYRLGGQNTEIINVIVRRS